MAPEPKRETAGAPAPYGELEAVATESVDAMGTLLAPAQRARTGERRRGGWAVGEVTRELAGERRRRSRAVGEVAREMAG